MKNLITAILMIFAVALGWFVVNKLRSLDRADLIANAVAVERVRATDSVKAEFLPVIESLRDSVQVQIDTVVRQTTRWRELPLQIDTLYVTDSIGDRVPAVALPQFTALQARHDTLQRSCSLLVTTCQALKDSVPKLQQLYDDAAAARDSVIANPKPFRRWILGACITAGPGYKGVSVGPSVCYRIY